MNGLVIAFVIIMAIIFGIAYLFPYILIGAGIIFVLYCLWLYFFDPIKKLKKDITEEPFLNCTIKPYKQYTIQELKELLGLFNTDIFKNSFSTNVMDKGEIYFYEDRIKNYVKKGNTHTCIVTGTKDYEVFLNLDETNQLINTYCTCQGFSNGYNCKHIYALVYHLTASENKNKIISILNQVVLASKEMINKFKVYTQMNSCINLTQVHSSLDYEIELLEECVQELKQKNTEQFALNRCKFIFNLIYELRMKISDMILELNRIELKMHKKTKNTPSDDDIFSMDNFGKFLLERKRLEWFYGGKEPTAFEKGLIALNHIVEKEEREQRELEEFLNEDDEENDEF